MKWTDAQGAKHERAFDDFAGAGRAFERELLENGAKDTAVYGWDDEGGLVKLAGVRMRAGDVPHHDFARKLGRTRRAA